MSVAIAGMKQIRRKNFMLPMINMMATGENITKLREKSGMTVRDIQQVFGFSTPQAVYKWQHGTAMPTVDNLVVLARVFGVTIDEILVVDGRDEFERA